MRSSEQMSLSVLHLKNQSTLVLIYDVPIKPFYGLSSVLTHYFPANDWHENAHTTLLRQKIYFYMIGLGDTKKNLLVFIFTL
jgi:hypothetical protein